jgi:hypothetical protein
MKNMVDNMSQENIIYDLSQTREFVKRVLMKLEDDEVFILLLNARKKWCPELSRSEEIMYRDLIRDNDIDGTLRKIKKIGCASRGIYVDMKSLREIDTSCMAIYILLDPRSTLKGYREFISDINKWIYESFVGKSKNLEFYRRMDIKLFSAIHKSRSRDLYFIVDIDKKDEDILTKITGLLKGQIKWISETHSGYHVIANKNYDTGTIIYRNIAGMEYVEILKDAMTPIPGTLHGGFKVAGIREELWK